MVILTLKLWINIEKKYKLTLKIDAEWLQISKIALEACIKDVTAQIEDIQKRSHVSIEICNVKFESIMDCMFYKQFKVSTRKLSFGVLLELHF